MELHIKSDFECIYYINGELYETADALSASEFDVVYITVMPLRLSLLPYTVKLTGAQNVSTELYTGVRLDDNNYLLSLSPRYMTVYASSAPLPPPSTIISRLFALVKNGDLNSAYAMLSDDLKTTIDKDDLSDFFSPYDRVAECSWEKSDGSTRFYLIGPAGAKLHSYTVKDEFIDNIVEE